MTDETKQRVVFAYEGGGGQFLHTPSGGAVFVECDPNYPRTGAAARARIEADWKVHAVVVCAREDLRAPIEAAFVKRHGIEMEGDR